MAWQFSLTLYILYSVTLDMGHYKACTLMDNKWDS